MLLGIHRKRYLQIIPVFAASYTIVLWSIWFIDKFQNNPFPAFDVAPYTSLLAPLYFLFFFRPAGKYTSRANTYFIGLCLIFASSSVIGVSTGGYISSFIASDSIIMILAAMISAGAMLILFWTHVLLLVLAMQVSTVNDTLNSEYGFIALLIYGVSGLIGWLIFRKDYVKSSESILHIRKALYTEQIHSEAILSSMNDGMLLLNLENKVQMINPVATKMIGVAQKDAIGKNISSILPKHSATIYNDNIQTASILDSCKDAVSSQKTVKVSTITIKHEDQKQLELSGSITPIKNLDDETASILITLHDISNLVRLQRLKDDFISTASHELRTPITVIAGYADLLLAQKDTGVLNYKQENYLKRTQQSAKRLIKLINDMLKLSKLQASMDDDDREIFNVNTTVSEAVDEMLDMLKNKKITITNNIGSHKVNISSGRLNQVMTNFLSNAAKYVPEGGKVRIESKDIDHKFVRIEISDNGPGISIDDQPNIFEKFARFNTKNKDSIEGTGLGLPIVKNIVDQWGGSVGLESDGKNGCKFWFTIPLYSLEKATKPTK